ncbi:unnamed protein product [Cylicocyclus nassatus]|uniref:Uncharacterized protein n=1 Tax=Cylicocyclus nassatus TaxID=53992 RepID=A0AA36M790_CYLNA|nr:unnamed protein product [Cylicocyclus nassatus]
MFWRTISIFCYAISSYASQEWDLISELPPGQTEDGIRLQAVYKFEVSKIRVTSWFDDRCSKWEIDVSLIYIKNPPSDIDNYCTLTYLVLMCRRRKHLSHDKSWLKQTLIDYLWSGVLPLDEMSVIQNLNYH